MSDEKKAPEQIDDKDLEDAKGGYSVWIGGSVKKDTSKVVMSGGSTMIKRPGTTNLERVHEDE